MVVSWRSAQAHTEAKYPAAAVQVESMVFADLVDSINHAYEDHDFLALQYLGTCLSSSVFGMPHDPPGIVKDLPEKPAQLRRDINLAHKLRDFEAMHHLGNRLAVVSVLEHAAQQAVTEKAATHQCGGLADGVGSWVRESVGAWRCPAGSRPSSPAVI